VIVNSDGYILTNNHVVSGADKIRVNLAGGEELEGEIVGTDAATDVAVIKVDSDGLKAAKLGNSDDIRVGEWVVAVGNPFGLQHSVTAGIISYKGRSNVRLADYEDFIQTDAAINPGNSGGPLVNLDGEVIGINTAIASNTGAYQGVGFAIPINLAKSVMDELITSGKVIRGWLGIYIQDITDAVAEAMGLSSTDGVLVAGVVETGPSEKAGLERGDVILELEGKKMKNGTELRNTIAATKPGTKVKLKILRDGKRRDLTVTLGELPQDEDTVLSAQTDALDDLGLALHDYNAELARRFDITGTGGVIITDVYPGAPAAEAGLRRGDLIVEMNQEEVESLDMIRARLSRMDPGDSVLFLVERGRGTLFVAMKIPE
jgi:serine protease Do